MYDLAASAALPSPPLAELAEEVATPEEEVETLVQAAASEALDVTL